MKLSRRHTKIFAIVMSIMMVVTGVLAMNLPDAFAASAVTTATAKVNASGGAYMRKSTSTKSDKVVLIKNKSIVTINKEIFASKSSTDATKRWFSVTYNGKSGYMRADVLNSFSYSCVNGKVNGTLNYRVGAGTGMTKKGTYKKGNSVTVVLEAKASGSSDQWYKIKAGSKYYYVSGKYVTIDKKQESQSTATVQEQKPTQEGTPDNKTTTTSDSSSSSSSTTSGSSSNSTAQNTYKVSATAKVDATNGAYMRKSTSTTSAKVVLLKNNTEVKVLKEFFTTKTGTSASQRWYLISSGSNTGYIRADLLKDIKYSGLKGSATGTLNYRAGAGTSMTKKGTFKNGAQMDVLLEAAANDSSDLWYKIKTTSAVAYVSAKYVKLGSSVATYTEKSTATQTNTTTDNTGIAASAGKKAEEPAKNEPVNVKPEFTVTDVNCPTSIGETVSYSLKGKITCNVDMAKAKFGFVDSSGKWVQSVTKEVNSKTFNISSIDGNLKFGKLPVGNYTYRGNIYIGDKSYTQVSKNFEVKKLEWPERIANTAISLCWPIGTPAGTYSYGSGNPTIAYKNALEAAYPNRSKWGAAPKVGASCDVFVGTSVVTSGYDKDFPRGLGNMSSGQWAHLDKSDLWQEVPYSYKESELQNGDIIIYQRFSGSEHICIYVKINGKGYLAEAAIKTYYGHLTKITSGSKIFKSSDKRKIKVYRAVN